METDGHVYVDSARRLVQEYIYFLRSVRPPSMHYKLCDKIIIPSAKV